MTIAQWPEYDRPREKLLRQGPQALSDTEILAIFLRTGIQGQSALDIARQLLQQYGSLRQLLNTPSATLYQMPGLGPAKVAQLQAAIELGRRYLQEQLQRTTALSNSVATKNYIVAQLRDLHQEVFAVLFLDKQHRVISFEKLFFGTIDHSIIHPRIIVQRALHHNAAAAILTHNHPSGIATPSEADIAMTETITTALALIDVKVLDHVIVGDNVTTSLAELGVV